MLDLYDITGLVGITLSSMSYARMQWQRDYGKTMSYSAFNLVSALLMGVSLSHSWNLASAVSNIVWGTISLYGVYRCLKYTLREKRATEAAAS